MRATSPLLLATFTAAVFAVAAPASASGLFELAPVRSNDLDLGARRLVSQQLHDGVSLASERLGHELAGGRRSLDRRSGRGAGLPRDGLRMESAVDKTRRGWLLDVNLVDRHQRAKVGARRHLFQTFDALVLGAGRIAADLVIGAVEAMIGQTGPSRQVEADYGDPEPRRAHGRRGHERRSRRGRHHHHHDGPGDTASPRPWWPADHAPPGAPTTVILVPAAGFAPVLGTTPPTTVHPTTWAQPQAEPEWVVGLPDAEFRSLLSAVRSQSFDSGKKELIIDVVTRTGVSCDQLYELLSELSFDSGKLEVVEAVASSVADPERATVLSGAFTFDHNRRQAVKAVIAYSR